MELRKAALQSVLQWHFAPETGAATRQVSIAFHLPAGPDQREEAAAMVQQMDLAMQYRKLAADQVRYRNRLAERQADLNRLEQQMQMLRDQQLGRMPEQMAEMQMLLEQAQARLEDARQGFARTMEESSRVDGRVLRRIDVTGLSDQVRDDLMARLQVHIGDSLTREIVERVAASVRQFDQHLVLDIRNVEGNQVDIRIMAPGRR